MNYSYRKVRYCYDSLGLQLFDTVIAYYPSYNLCIKGFFLNFKSKTWSKPEDNKDFFSEIILFSESPSKLPKMFTNDNIVILSAKLDGSPITIMISRMVLIEKIDIKKEEALKEVKSW